MSTRTTFHLSISRPALALARVRAWLAARDPILLVAPIIASTLIGLILGVQLWRVLRPAHTTATQPTSLPAIMIIATARAVALPTPLPTTAPRLVTAYDQPNGSAFPDAIPEPAPSAWIGRWGDGWIEVTWTPNPVWIRVVDLGANLADVRPIPRVQIAPVVVSAPAQPEQPYKVANESQQTTFGEPTAVAAYRQQIGVTAEDDARALAAHVAREIAFCNANPENASCIASPPSMENP